MPWEQSQHMSCFLFHLKWVTASWPSLNVDRNQIRGALTIAGWKKEGAADSQPNPVLPVANLGCGVRWQEPWALFLGGADCSQHLLRPPHAAAPKKMLELVKHAISPHQTS